MLSSDTQAPSNNEHQKVWTLLPWSVNQSLDSIEQAFVNRHVKTCITCRIELNQQQQVFDKIQQAGILQQKESKHNLNSMTLQNLTSLKKYSNISPISF